ncbi:MAG: YdcF family protein [Acidobacteria bacterium]|nr:YdcF family protein [Acidobacteriota bacterium]
MRRRTLLLLALLLGVFAIAYPSWLPYVGTYLVRAEQPSKADAAIVLAGDSFGFRILRAAELVRDGFVPTVFVSGPAPFYDRNEADLAIAMAVAKGHPPSVFQPVRMRADSTREEGAILLRHLRERNIRRFLIVTSDFHTRRTNRIYRSLAATIYPEADFHVVQAPSEYFTSATWWTNRPSRKIVLMEWMKTVAGCLGI